MKVLHIINSLNIGGAEKLIVDLVPSLNSSEINTDLLVLKRSNNFFTKKMKGQTVHFLSTGSLYNFVLIFKIIPYLKKYDIVHIHLFPSLYWVVLARIISFSKAKLVYTEHSTQNRRRKHYALKYIDKFIYSFIEVTICITHATQINLNKHLNQNKKTVVINNGINITEYLKTDPNINFFDKKDIILLQVSSFRKQKDQRTLIKSLKLLPNNYKLLLVGEGDLKKDCITFVKDQKLEERVIFLGKRKDVSELLNYSDIIIQSSYYEGFGLAALEGMAANKPVIASDVPGLKEVVGGYGMLFEVGNHKQLATKIIELGSNRETYTYIKNRCYNRSLDYSINKMTKEYIKIYQQIYDKT